MTASGVPAIDFAWHTLHDNKTNTTEGVGNINRDLRNRNYLFTKLLEKVKNMGRCWVSNYCFLPKVMLSYIQEELNTRSNLRIFNNTVLKKVVKDSRVITQIETI